MAKIPFSIVYRPQIEAGEYKVELRDGRPVKIIYWEAKGPSPIIGLFIADDGYETTTQVHSNGRWSDDDSYESDYDLFIVTPEEEMTEFEKKLWEVLKSEGSPIGPIEKFTNEDKEVFHSYAAELLALARKELEPEVLKRLEEAYKNQDEVVYENGKRDALKDLPRWRKCTDADGLDPYIIKPWIVRFDNDVIMDSAIIHHGYYLGFADLEKLPGFKGE